jgi:hypothetical protein
MKTPQLLGVLALTIPALASAAEGDLPRRTSGWYFGAGGGYSTLELQQEPLNISGGDFSYKFLGGYRFPRAFLPWGINIGFEAAWVDLGEVDEDAPGANLSLAVDGFEGYLVGWFPMSRSFELFGKAGVYAWDAQFAVNGTVEDKNDGTDIALAVGVAYQTGGQLGFQLELEGYDLFERALMATASVLYQFK